MELKFRHFVIFQFLDVLTTVIAITHFGLTEMNPLVNSVFQEYGVIVGIIIFKIIGLVILYCIFIGFSESTKKIALNIVCTMYSVVVLNNAYQMIVRL